MIVAQSPGYLEACVKAAREAIEAFLADVDLVLDDDTLIVPSQTPNGFPAALREGLGLSERGVVDAGDELGPAHTAGPLLALDKAMQDGRFASAKRIVFVTVTPGIVVSVALYEQ
jgi:3-oxoacyl-[acyl-carrier-protein] synthase III